MMWSGGRLESEGEGIVDQFDRRQIDCNAYTLRMGDEVYVSPSTDKGDSRVVSLSTRESFSIPPGQFAFLLTHERVSIPLNAMGFLNMKSGIKLRGLINVSGFHVDPGYSGRLVFSVYNAGPRAVTIRQGDDCFLLWISSLTDENIGYSKSGEGFSGIDSKLVNDISGDVVSLSSFSKRLSDLEGRYQSVTGAYGVIVSLLVAILAGLIVAVCVWFFGGK